ncbi:winged helix-turn-helix transcriptional regulator [Actinorugispora endophytica]|nr:helix-turn-helix domain-containing protein [Actinorugispora endophytica]
MSAPATPAAPSGDDYDRLVPDVFARDCLSRHVLADVSGKWGTLALLALHEGAYRFNALRRRIDGVSEKMLAQTLQALERDGLVNRDAQAAIPPRVEYSLTPLGVRIAGRLAAFVELLEEAVPEITEARRSYDARR